MMWKADLIGQDSCKTHPPRRVYPKNRGWETLRVFLVWAGYALWKQ